MVSRLHFVTVRSFPADRKLDEERGRSHGNWQEIRGSLSKGTEDGQRAGRRLRPIRENSQR